VTIFEAIKDLKCPCCGSKLQIKDDTKNGYINPERLQRAFGDKTD
jgi:hypothetical protein